MDDEIDDMAAYSALLSRGGKIIERKYVSVKHSGEYMRWMAETLARSFDKKRRPPYRLLMELIPVLMEASELADRSEDGESACDALLCGFGLKPEKGKGRRPVASFYEIINMMEPLIKNDLTIREAAKITAETFKIGESTTRRYWSTYEKLNSDNE